MHVTHMNTHRTNYLKDLCAYKPYFYNMNRAYVDDNFELNVNEEQLIEMQNAISIERKWDIGSVDKHNE